MTEVTDKMVEEACHAFGWCLDRNSMRAAIAAALAAQAPVSIRCPECAKANADRDERFGRKP